MQLSKYLKAYPAGPGQVLLYSTKQTSKVVVSEAVYEAMKEGGLSPNAEATLAQYGFLVEDRDAERREICDLVDNAETNREVCNAVVVMNLDCNLDCIYCFEGILKGKKYMTQETADAVVDFLDAMSFQRGKRLKVTFYGGEPLMSFERVKNIAKKLHERSNGLSLTTFMVTNGVLLTRKRVEELLPYGFDGAKITIDGVRENHDKYRPLRSGGKSFDAIVKNVKETCDLIRIQIGGNFTEENYRDFPKLLDYLISEGITPDKLRSIKFDAIFRTHEDTVLPEYRDVGCESTSEAWADEANFFLREEVLKRGFHVPQQKPGACTVEYKDDVIVNYNGDCYKCPVFIDKPELKIGSVFDGIHDYLDSHSLGRWKNQDCMQCEYLPLCFGGCRFSTLLKDGNMREVDCRKQFYDTSLEGFIKQDVKYVKQVKA